MIMGNGGPTIRGTATGKIINYNEKRDEIFKIAKEKLTCIANAKYFLHKVFPNINPEKYSELKILMLCGSEGYRNVNYSRETLAHGLRKICGDNFVEYPKLNVLYKNCKKIHKYVPGAKCQKARHGDEGD